MIDPKALRLGNWIHRKGSSRYGIVNGDLLALLEKDEKLREGFEYVELTTELLRAAGFERNNSLELKKDWFLCYDDFKKILYIQVELDEADGINPVIDRIDLPQIKELHRLQQIYELFTGSELPLPESAKIIPELSQNNP